MHRKIKEVTEKFRKRHIGKLVNSDQHVIISIEEKKRTWKEYLNQLFEDQERREPTEVQATSGPYIMKEEVESAMKLMKDGKGAGPDNIQIEIIKLIEEEGIKKLTRLFNDIYNTGIIPREWRKSEFITLPKKPGAKNCEDYRTISLMSHLLKLFLKIIHRRIYNICEGHISPNQFGFINAVGTREALFSVQVLFQRSRDVNCDIYVCLIDHKKHLIEYNTTK